jgi:hypothetical protein
MRVRQLGSANKIFRGAIDFASTDTTNSLHHPHVRTHCVYAHAKHKHAHTSKSKHTSGCWGLREVTTMASSITIAHAAAAPPTAAVRLIVNFRLQGLNLESVAFRGRKRPLPDLSMGDVTYFLVGREHAVTADVQQHCDGARGVCKNWLGSLGSMQRPSSRDRQVCPPAPEHAPKTPGWLQSAGVHECDKRHGISKETYLYVKRDLFVCQRDIFVCQKRPICMWQAPRHNFSKALSIAHSQKSSL